MSRLGFRLASRSLEAGVRVRGVCAKRKNPTWNRLHWGLGVWPHVRLLEEDDDDVTSRSHRV